MIDRLVLVFLLSLSAWLVLHCEEYHLLDSLEW